MNPRTPLRRVADPLDGSERLAAHVSLDVLAAFAPDGRLKGLGKGIDGGDADAVETGGDAVGLALELASGVKLAHHHLERRLPLAGVDVNGDAPAVVRDGDRPVGQETDLDGRAVAGHRLVDRVVDDLEDQVMESADARVADEHPGALADGIEALEDLDFPGAVIRRSFPGCGHA